MLTCKEVAERATDYMEGQVSMGTRFWFLVHLARCSACRAYLRQMRLTVSLLRRVGDEAPPEPVKAELLAMFRAQQPASGVMSARHANGMRGIAGSLLAALDVLVRGQRALLAIATLLLGSIALLTSVRPMPGGPVPLADGFMCLGKEILGGLVPLATVIALARFGGRALSWGVYAVAAGLGALVGQASLHVACPEVGMRFHLLAFHTGGVLLAVLLGAIASQLQTVRARS